MYNFMLRTISTLYRRFRARNYNVILKREEKLGVQSDQNFWNNYSFSKLMLFTHTHFTNEKHSYQIVEMFLGVIILALAVFLLPTIAIFYYYCFIQIILSVLILQLLCIAG